MIFLKKKKCHHFMESILFSDKLNKKKAIGLIHRLYITQLKNAQKHTASTKTKSEVRGGGRKPRPQKGQGYARSGSIRSPLLLANHAETQLPRGRIDPHLFELLRE